MEEIKQHPVFIQELDKDRSLANCLNTAYEDVSHNLKSLFKQLLPYLLAYAASAGLMTMFQVVSKSGGAFFSVFLLFVFSILTLVAAFAFTGKVASFANAVDPKKNALRIASISIPVVAAYIIVAIVGLMVCIFATSAVGSDAMDNKLVQNFMLKTSIYLGVFILFMIVTVPPFAYSMTKYIMDSESKFTQAIGKDWLVGFRHWGFIFGVTFVVGLVVLVVQLLVGAPFNIAMGAFTLSNIGVEAGDPSGMPAAYWLIAFLGTFVSVFCAGIFMVWQMFVYYYMYGSIEKREYERNEAKNFVH